MTNSKKKEIYLNLIYGESVIQEKENNWKNILEEINENKLNMIIGNLNIIWEVEGKGTF